MKVIKSYIFIIVFFFAPYGDSLHLKPVLFPFKDPHVFLPDGMKATFNQRVAVNSGFVSGFDMVYTHQYWNFLANQNPLPFMEGVDSTPREIFFMDDVRDLLSGVRENSINWDETPTIFLSGHGVGGIPVLKSPKYVGRNPSDQLPKHSFATVDDIAIIIERGLEVPKNYTGTLVCLTCFGSLANRAGPSLAAALSTTLYNVGYHNLVVEGPIGVLVSAANANNAKQYVLDNIAPAPSDLGVFGLSDTDLHWQFVGNSTGLNQWVVDLYGGRILPFTNPASKRQFFNGQALYHPDDSL